MGKVACIVILGTALAACGSDMEQRAATGGVAGAAVGGPIGAAVGATAGAVVNQTAKSGDNQNTAPK